MSKKNSHSLNPWKTKSSKIVYKNPWIKVHEDKVIRPDGKGGIYGVIDKQDGIGIVVLDYKNRVYLAGQWRYLTGKYTLSIIGGTREDGETPLASAKRELLEEVSLVANKWEHLITFYPSLEVFNEKVYMFLARGLSKINNKKDMAEDVRAKKVDFNKAIDMIRRGEIVDGFAIVGLLAAKERLNK